MQKELKACGKNGYGETFWKLCVPDEHCSPGLEVGITACERGVTIGGRLIKWTELDAARAPLSAPSHGEQVREGFDAEPFIATIHMIREAYAEAIAVAYAPGSEAFRDAKEKAQKLEQNLAKLIRIAAAPSAGSQGGDV